MDSDDCAVLADRAVLVVCAAVALLFALGVIR